MSTKTNTKSSKKRLKLTEEQRQVIIDSVKLDYSKKNIKKLANEFDITERYVYKLAKDDKLKKDSKQDITENQSEFTKKANHIIELVFARLEKELMNNDKITISQLSTTLGILYDKSRLENNLSTSNNDLHINIKIER